VSRRRPLRIAYTSPYCWPDIRRGGERLLHELSRSMAKLGHDVTVISTSSEPGTTTEHGVRMLRLPKPAGDEGGPHEYRCAKLMIKPLLLGRYDVVHSLGPADAAASIRAAKLHRRRRTVYTHLGIPDRRYYEQEPDWRWHAYVAEHIDVYGCMSRHAARLFESGFGREAALTPGGVHLDDFTMSSQRADRPTLVYAGALTVSRKHVGDLLEATAILSTRRPDVCLRLVGPGDPSALLAAAPEAARERTEVIAPDDADLPKIYAEAWATVLPSVNEAFGIVLVESLACGTPIVVCDDAAPPELARPGVGEIAAPRDPVSLAQACERALDLAVQDGIEERCRAAAVPYDWDTRIAPAVEALYRT
jgi:glycosyltransferase involved in cell wall biosynthesis